MNRVNMGRATLYGILLAVAAYGAQNTGLQDGVTATLEGAIAPDGILQATMTVTAVGTPSTPYLGPLMRDQGVVSPLLFGSFVRGRQLESTAHVTGAGTPDLPAQIRLRIHEEFLLPIQRQQTLTLDLIPMSLPVGAAPTGTPKAGQDTRYREEISLEIPAGFTAPGLSGVNEDRPFGRYESAAKMDGGRLIVTRELLLRAQGAGATSESELSSFWKIVREDQGKRFTLIRIMHTDPAKWIESVSPGAANHYGTVAYDQHEYDSARRLFERVVRFRPGDPQAWNNLGRALAALGRWDEAQKAYETQIGINSQDQYAYNNLGLLQERQGRWRAAVTNFRKQLEVHPGDTHATANLPRALIHVERWPEAEAAASRALEFQPGNAQQKMYLAVARICQGKGDAQQELTRAWGSRPSASILNDAAFYLTDCGKEYQLAESLVRRALDQVEAAGDPAGGRTMASAINHQESISNCLDTYGWLQFKQGRIEPALVALTAAATLAPRAEVYAHLAEVEAKAGRPDAPVHWRQATYLEPGRIDEAPPSLAQVTSRQAIGPLSIDHAWYPLSATLPEQPIGSLSAGIAAYFFVSANASGAVESVRALDRNDESAKSLLPAVRAIPFPVAEADGRQFPTVYLVKVSKSADGKAAVARSIAPEAVALAIDLAPDEFPLPAPADAAVSGTTAAKATPAPGVIIAPRLLQQISPAYTEEARRAHLEGTVRLRIVIGVDGIVNDLQVEQSLGLGLDEQAMLAVRQWRYSPAQKGGTPVLVNSQVDVIFQLRGAEQKPNPWHLARVEFQAPQSSMRPIFNGGSEPRVARDGAAATATLAFDIDERGIPVHARVEKASSEEWAKDALDAVAKWRFTPAMQEDRAIVVSCTMEFVRGN
jgi:periplasmic protein TonB